jgi:hypothetical protein
MLALAGLAVAVPALAATRPWQPTLGSPTRHDIPTGTSRTAVPGDELAVLAILRRPQGPQDRSAAVQTLLRSVGQEFDGVRLASIRLVNSASGHRALVLSAQSIGMSFGGSQRETHDPICLIVDSGGLCGNLHALQSGGLLDVMATRITGLVPDDVATVAITFADGKTITTAVRDNTFWSTRPRIVRRPGVQRPAPGRHTTTPTHVTAPITSIRWLDHQGKLLQTVPGR